MNKKQKSNESKEAAAVIKLRHGGKAVIRGESFTDDWNNLVEAVLLDELGEFVENEESDEIKIGMVAGAEFALRQLPLQLLLAKMSCLLTMACLHRLEQAAKKRSQFASTPFANN